MIGVVYLSDRILNYDLEGFSVDKTDVLVVMIVLIMVMGPWFFGRYERLVYDSKHSFIVKNRPFFVEGGPFTAPPFVFIVLVIFFVILRLLFELRK